jgi:hypothetical protein
VDSKKAKSGDEVQAKTTSDVKSEGKTVIPRGSRLIGHVTQASAKGKGDADSTLTVVFDHAVLRSGEQVALNATIRALAVAQPPAPLTAMSSGNDPSYAGGMPHPAGGGVSPVGTVGSATGGALGTAAATTDGAVGGVANDVGGTVASTHTTSGAGLNAAGELSPRARGVFGLPGVTLSQAAGATAGASNGTTITSTGKTVHLDSGTQLVLAVTGSASNQ